MESNFNSSSNRIRRRSSIGLDHVGSPRDILSPSPRGSPSPRSTLSGQTD